MQLIIQQITLLKLCGNETLQTVCIEAVNQFCVTPGYISQMCANFQLNQSSNFVGVISNRYHLIFTIVVQING